MHMEDDEVLTNKQKDYSSSSTGGVLRMETFNQFFLNSRKTHKTIKNMYPSKSLSWRIYTHVKLRRMQESYFINNPGNKN